MLFIKTIMELWTPILLLLFCTFDIVYGINELLQKNMVAVNGQILSLIVTGLCPEGWNSAPNIRTCFLLISKVSSWDNSEAICQNRCGHMAALTSKG